MRCVVPDAPGGRLLLPKSLYYRPCALECCVGSLFIRNVHGRSASVRTRDGCAIFLFELTGIILMARLIPAR